MSFGPTDDLVACIREPSYENAQSLLSELNLAEAPTRDEVNQTIEEKLLLPKETLPEHWLGTYQIHWEHKVPVPSLLTLNPSPPPTMLSFQRSGLQGRVTGYVEIPTPHISAGRTSTSMARAPAPSKNFVRGKAGYVPFLPGGLDEVDVALEDENAKSSREQQGLRTIPPGFTRGLRLPGEEDIGDPLPPLEDMPVGVPRRIVEREEKGIAQTSIFSSLGQSQLDTEIDELLPSSRMSLAPPVSSKIARRGNIQKRDWAHIVDVNKPMTNFHELVPDMAHKYPFELDTFQKEAVYHLEMGDSVFVAAHTSAGKTVVAEYAIALAAKHMTRTIYTSPIKALSNQKYRDFKQTFSASSVGILTGDVQINPEANCLIMTTEILRSMLYKGADLIRDVEFVVFDEVHYVSDAERGVVWEEVIIMLPDHVNIILLSATVPNANEFAEWVGRTKKKDIYVISTPKRPVPLEHYLYAGRETFKIVDATGTFLTQGYKDAGEALRRKQDKEREAAGLAPITSRLGARAATAQGGAQRGGPGRGGGQRGAPPTRGGGRGGPPRGGSATGPRTFHSQDKNLYVHLVSYLRKKDLLPVVVFTFSKKKCEEHAGTLTNIDLCTSVEKSEVHVAVEKALSRLKGSDKKLPQIARMRDLLSRGIGVHHGGLLPIVKELVEILFSRGLVKVLFATETFAMGVNMPARCVVFSSIRKHDGRSFREILPGEYTQMSGRAGRRGLDATGVVIIIAGDELRETGVFTTMILGKPSKLQSQFRLTYNMILNLLRVEALRVEEMIKRSFSENASQSLLPQQQKQVHESEKALLAWEKPECPVCDPDIGKFYETSAGIVSCYQGMLEAAIKDRNGSKNFASGRVVVLRDGHFKTNVGILLKAAPRATNEDPSFFVLACVDERTKNEENDVDPQSIPPLWLTDPSVLRVDKVLYDVKLVPITSIALVTERLIKCEVGDILDRLKIAPMKEAAMELAKVTEDWIAKQQIPEVDWSKLRGLDFQELLNRRNDLIRRLEGSGCVLCEKFTEHYAIHHGKEVLIKNIANLKFALSDQNLDLLPEYEQRIQVLKELSFIDANSTVSLKGRVACEINSAHELILTELILENTLASYTPEEVVALLSCFVFQEKTEVEPEVPLKLKEGEKAIRAIADRVGNIQLAHSVAEDIEAKLKFGLMEVVYEWAKGMPFEQITNLTDVPEGTIVRVITRLDETCREVRDAARVIGDADLFKKMEESQIKIKRDIVFAASLYF